MSVGLLVVRLLYRFYVFGHLSKWFTFFCFCHSFVCRVAVLIHLLPTVTYMKCWGLRESSLSAVTNAGAGQIDSHKHLNPNILYMMLQGVILSLSNISD